MSNKAFQQLKHKWNLSEDTSVDDLLVYAQKKLQSDLDNPELVYTVAELQRHIGDTNEASKTYRKAVTLTDKLTQQRGELLEQRLEKKRDHTRAKFLLYTFLPLIILCLGTAILWKTLSAPEKLSADADPNKFAFTKWLAKQQMAEIMTTLQKQNPELTFDFNRSSASAQSPMDFLQSMMKPDALGKLKRDQARAANAKNKKGGSQPAFQCSLEAPVRCDADDVPNVSGEPREEVVLLMESYRSILKTEQDCEKLEKSIESIGEQLEWRKAEKRIKADLEDLAVECFYRKENVEKTLEHARKLQCVSDAGYINSVYWYKTAIHHKSGDLDAARVSYQCYQEATKYIEENESFSPSYVAARHREAGALAWLYFDDLSTAMNELLTARKVLKSYSKQTPRMLEVISEINLDLMETYVTANIDIDAFQELLEEINSSGLLTDGYKQIKDTLVAIYYLQNKNYQPATVALNNLSSRFKLMPEFICGWDWSGFRRGLKDSITDDEIREQAINLVDISNCYVPQTMGKRISDTQKVLQWIKGR